MRVIAGSKKGSRLETLKGMDVRPTTDKVKESIFNIIQFDLPGCRFLDLFSGSGQIGIEALSRGAAHVTFVDSARQSINVIKKNLNALNLCENFDVVNMDSLLFLKRVTDSFDIVFLDPPYKLGLLQEALLLLPHILKKDAKIICEHPIEEPLPSKVENFSIYKEYRYGKIVLSIYRCEGV